MKKLQLLLLLLMMLGTSKNANSQWINSISVNPQFPSSVDTLRIYTDCSFPSGSCDQHSQFLTPAGNQIFGQATHCLGMLTFICNYTDTFLVNPLAPGNYKFFLHLNSGSLPSPCSGTTSGSVDSLEFTVTPANFITNPDQQCKQYFFPNPSSGILHIHSTGNFSAGGRQNYFLSDPAGKLIRSGSINLQDEIINISDLENGIYFLQLKGDNSRPGNPVKLVLFR